MPSAFGAFLEAMDATVHTCSQQHPEEQLFAATTVMLDRDSNPFICVGGAANRTPITFCPYCGVNLIPASLPKCSFSAGTQEQRRALAAKIAAGMAHDYGGISMMTLGYWVSDILGPNGCEDFAYAILTDHDFDLPEASRAFLMALAANDGNLTKTLYLMLGVDEGLQREFQKWSKTEGLTRGEFLSALAHS